MDLKSNIKAVSLTFDLFVCYPIGHQNRDLIKPLIKGSDFVDILYLVTV